MTTNLIQFVRFASHRVEQGADFSSVEEPVNCTLGNKVRI